MDQLRLNNLRVLTLGSILIFFQIIVQAGDEVQH